jgi:hypothetical protein
MIVSLVQLLDFPLSPMSCYLKTEKTILSITDDVGQGEGAEKRYSRSLKGWDKVLKGLKELVESKKGIV